MADILRSSDVIVLILSLLLAYALYRARPSQSKNLPPGPKGLFLFGNTFQIPGTFVCLYFTEMARKYGERRPVQCGKREIDLLEMVQATLST